MKNIGLAVKEQTLDPKKNLVLLGIANWSTIRNNHLLINSDNRLKYTDFLDKTYEGNIFLKKHASLQPNHTHFILVDNSQLNVYGGEIDLRNKIEKAVSNFDYESQNFKNKRKSFKANTNEKFKQKIPIVLIVVGGGPNTFEMCRSAVENGSPVLFIEGSGRCADIFADVYKRIRSKKITQDIDDIENCFEASG